jgi:hypothetical protein
MGSQGGRVVTTVKQKQPRERKPVTIGHRTECDVDMHIGEPGAAHAWDAARQTLGLPSDSELLGVTGPELVDGQCRWALTVRLGTQATAKPEQTRVTLQLDRELEIALGTWMVQRGYTSLGIAARAKLRESFGIPNGGGR